MRCLLNDESAWVRLHITMVSNAKFPYDEKKTDTDALNLETLVNFLSCRQLIRFPLNIATLRIPLSSQTVHIILILRFLYTKRRQMSRVI